MIDGNLALKLEKDFNPPYSQHWSAAAGFLTDPRFQRDEKLAPRRKSSRDSLCWIYWRLGTAEVGRDDSTSARK